MSDNDPLDEMCGTCGKDFTDCMCCECGDTDGAQYTEGVYCKECIEYERELQQLDD